MKDELPTNTHIHEPARRQANNSPATMGSSRHVPSHNAVFTLIISVFLVGMFCATAAFHSLPGKSDVGRSYLEGRAYQALPEINPDSIATGKFQTEFEQFVSDSVPYRESTVLAYAGLQRMQIALARLPFRYTEFPTYFGSSYLFSSRWHSTYMGPQQASKKNLTALEKTASALSGSVAKHNNQAWYVAVVDRVHNSEACPAYQLVSNQLTTKAISETLEQACRESCTPVDLAQNDTETYYQHYFSTDHHWRIQGAYAAYRKIISALGKSPVEQVEFFVACEEPFYGSASRAGRDTDAYDIAYDLSYDKASLLIRFDGKTQSDSFIDYAYGNSAPYEKLHLFENVYSSLFHDDMSFFSIKNETIDDGSSLLIVGDSYSNCIERLFAESYETVYVIDPRKYEKSLSAFLANHEVDDILLLASSTTLFSDKIPKFFE